MKQDDIKFYLRSHLKRPSLEFKWTDEDNEKFFIFIKENSSEKFLHDKENLLLIRECFASYFEHVGYILFKIKKDQVRLKVLPYSEDVKNTKNINKITNIIDENKDSITTDYNGKKDQIYLDNDLKDKIFSYLETIKDKQINTKELVRFSVRKALELKDEDLIMLKQDCIFVKLCDITKRNEDTEDRRFNGIDEEEMSDFCKEHFSNGEKNSFFYLSAKLFVEKYFLEININNNDYEKKVFSLIQLIITEQLINKFDNCAEFFKGFAGYIFRRNFEKVFEYIAELVLHEVSISNSYMIDFLKYYSLGVVVIDGKKYKIPNLETEGGLKWNVVSMLSIVRVYLKKELVIKNVKHEMNATKAEIKALFIDGLSPVEYDRKNKEETNNITKILIDYEKSIENCEDSLQLAKSTDEKEELKKQIKFTKERVQEKKEEKKVLSNKSIKQNATNKFITLEKNLELMIRVLEKESKILNQNKDSFESIKNVLVKALISKKKLV